MTAYDGAVGDVGKALVRQNLPAVAFRKGMLLPDLVKLGTDEQDRVWAIRSIR
jgi:hypothetical protein